MARRGLKLKVRGQGQEAVGLTSILDRGQFFSVALTLSSDCCLSIDILFEDLFQSFFTLDLY